MSRTPRDRALVALSALLAVAAAAVLVYVASRDRCAGEAVFDPALRISVCHRRGR